MAMAPKKAAPEKEKEVAEEDVLARFKISAPLRSARLCKLGGMRPVRVPTERATIAAAVEALPYGGRVLLEPGRHWIDATISLFKPIEIMGTAAAGVTPPPRIKLVIERFSIGSFDEWLGAEEVLVMSRGHSALRVAHAHLALVSLTLSVESEESMEPLEKAHQKIERIQERIKSIGSRGAHIQRTAAQADLRAASGSNFFSQVTISLYLPYISLYLPYI